MKANTHIRPTKKSELNLKLELHILSIFYQWEIHIHEKESSLQLYSSSIE